MDTKELIMIIRMLADIKNIRLAAIEKEVNMPRNSLSGMLNGKRGFPKKWQEKLTLYCGYISNASSSQALTDQNFAQLCAFCPYRAITSGSAPAC